MTNFSRPSSFIHILCLTTTERNFIAFNIEYCNQVIDDEYVDGYMTWEDIKTEWRRE